jgi:hypothetical protein
MVSTKVLTTGFAADKGIPSVHRMANATADRRIARTPPRMISSSCGGFVASTVADIGRLPVS